MPLCRCLSNFRSARKHGLLLSIVNVCKVKGRASQTIVCESFVGFIATQFASGGPKAAHLGYSKLIRNNV